MAKAFSSVSQEIEALNLESLPKRVKDKIETINLEEIPKLRPETVHKKMEKKKIKMSMTPDDIHPRISKEFAPFLAAPIADLFNTILLTGHYPRQWVTEYITPIPKSAESLETEADIRPITIIPNTAKLFNSFIADWLQPIIKPRMDPAQLGGEKGSSILHYLILLFEFIFSDTDSQKTEPHAVIAALVDFEKGFTKVNHNKVLIRLSD